MTTIPTLGAIDMGAGDRKGTVVHIFGNIDLRILGSLMVLSVLSCKM